MGSFRRIKTSKLGVLIVSQLAEAEVISDRTDPNYRGCLLCEHEKTSHQAFGIESGKLNGWP